MWSVILVLFYAFVAVSTALKSNSSLLEGKVKHGINGAQPELYYFPLHFVVSIRRQNYDTQEIEHVCMGCMISAVKGVMPYECKQEGKEHYVSTDKDEYSNTEWNLIDHFEKPTAKKYLRWIAFFVMTKPLWRKHELPTFAEFVNIPHIRDYNAGVAVSWNQLVQNPKPGQKLLGIQIRPLNELTQSDPAFIFQSYPENDFMLDREDMGGPVFLNNKLIGILSMNLGICSRVLRLQHPLESECYLDRY